MIITKSILLRLPSRKAVRIRKKQSVPEGHTRLQACKVLKRVVWLQYDGIERRPVCPHLDYTSHCRAVRPAIGMLNEPLRLADPSALTKAMNGIYGLSCREQECI